MNRIVTIEESYLHDWRLCECRECDSIKRDYEQEMGT